MVSAPTLNATQPAQAQAGNAAAAQATPLDEARKATANTPEGLAMAIVTEDAKSLTAAQGIGKKIAQRIILELKDKMAKETASGLDFSGGKGAAVPAVFTSKATEAAAALAVLGYSTQEVQMALKGVDVENLPLEEIIRQSLKKMVK